MLRIGESCNSLVNACHSLSSFVCGLRYCWLWCPIRKMSLLKSLVSIGRWVGYLLVCVSFIVCWMRGIKCISLLPYTYGLLL